MVCPTLLCLCWQLVLHLPCCVHIISQEQVQHIFFICSERSDASIRLLLMGLLGVLQMAA
jgi:hypothetical protein